MMEIKEILQKKNPSVETLISCFEKVRQHGNVGVIKFDGERAQAAYTVFISFPGKETQLIRADEDDLKNALIKVLAVYVKTKENK